MDLLVLDWETYYGADYTLSKMTTEEYVRDPRFEAILCAVKRNSERAFWVPRDEIGYMLKDQRADKAMCCFHHAHFDGLIMNYHYGMRPAGILDTLGMARALYGANGRLSLEQLCIREGIGEKGTEVHNVKGMHYADFDPIALKRYGDYSVNDAEKTYLLALKYATQFHKTELQIYDEVVRMFTEPFFLLDREMLDNYRMWLSAEKMALLFKAGVTQKELMSQEKFAECLRNLGIDPPMKVSPSDPTKLIYAFAKSDVGMQQLQEHEDEQVQILVEARLKNKTTIAEKGAERLIAMGGRGPATVYLKVAGASGTHRLSGGDKFNWQSMKRGSDLRNSVQAPLGWKCVVVDSSTIEARLLDWLAGQDDMVEVYRKQDNKTGPDMYCYLAGFIYERAIVKGVDDDERQMGKVAKLGLGFGMGTSKFMISVRRQAKVKARNPDGSFVLDADGKPKEVPLILDAAFANKVVHDVYRQKHKKVQQLWWRAEDILGCIERGEIGVNVDFRGIVKTCKDGLIMPNGLKILYPDLKFTPDMEPDGQGGMRKVVVKGKVRGEWSFWNGKMREKIYGPKVIENIIQCLARIVVFNQCLRTVQQLRRENVPVKWGHSVHDEGVFGAPDFFAPYVLKVAMQQFRTPLDWCETLPLNCEGGFHQRYGKAKK